MPQVLRDVALAHAVNLLQQEDAPTLQRQFAHRSAEQQQSLLRLELRLDGLAVGQRTQLPGRSSSESTNRCSPRSRWFNARFLAVFSRKARG